MSMAKRLLGGGGVGNGAQCEVSTDPILSTSHASLLAMYTMDNISGATLFDESPNSRDGTITGATTVTGIIGDGLNFDGSNDSVVAPHPQHTSLESMTFWFKPPTTTPGSGDEDTMFTRTNNGDGSISAYWDSATAGFRGAVRFFVEGDVGSVDWIGANVLDTARFYFLGITVAATSAKTYLYDDTGVQLELGSITLTKPMTLADTNQNSLFLGQIGGNSNFAQVVLDQFRSFTDIELSLAQIEALVTEGVCS